MTDRRTIKLAGYPQRAHAIQLIESAPDGYVATIGEETRSLAQNRLMWPLIEDMQKQVEGMKPFTPDQVKLRFLNELDNEMQMLPELYGGGQFVAGQRSSTLTKGDFTNLIELMFKYGAEQGVRWSRKSEQTMAEMNG